MFLIIFATAAIPSYICNQIGLYYGYQMGYSEGINNQFHGDMLGISSSTESDVNWCFNSNEEVLGDFISSSSSNLASINNDIKLGCVNTYFRGWNDAYKFVTKSI